MKLKNGTLNHPHNNMKTCPRCKKKTYIVSIFGSVCNSCLYDPKYDELPSTE